MSQEDATVDEGNLTSLTTGCGLGRFPDVFDVLIDTTGVGIFSATGLDPITVTGFGGSGTIGVPPRTKKNDRKLSNRNDFLIAQKWRKKNKKTKVYIILINDSQTFL